MLRLYLRTDENPDTLLPDGVIDVQQSKGELAELGLGLSHAVHVHIVIIVVPRGKTAPAGQSLA